jgi:hypothetical protein
MPRRASAAAGELDDDGVLLGVLRSKRASSKIRFTFSIRKFRRRFLEVIVGVVRRATPYFS